MNQFLIELLQFLTNLSHMDSLALSHFGSDLKAHILEAAKNWHVQHEFSGCRCLYLVPLQLSHKGMDQKSNLSSSQSLAPGLIGPFLGKLIEVARFIDERCCVI